MPNKKPIIPAAPIGRRTMFIPEVRQIIVQTLASGSPSTYAVQLAGISMATLMVWLAVGRAIRDGIPHSAMPASEEARAEYLEFLYQVEKARAGQRIQAVQSVLKAGREHWTHRKTGLIRFQAPPPMTYCDPKTGEIVFADPAEKRFEAQLSGEAWAHHEGSWQAMGWFLERTDPANFARRDIVEVNINLIRQFVETAKAAGVDPDEALRQFEEMLRAESRSLNAESGEDGSSATE